MTWLLSLLTGFSLRTYIIAAAVVAFGLWTAHWYGIGYSAADAMWKAKQLEATIAELKAQIAANEEIRKDAEADVRAAEAEERKLKELIDALRNDKSCPLTPEHVDGVRRIDESP